MRDYGCEKKIDMEGELKKIGGINQGIQNLNWLWN